MAIYEKGVKTQLTKNFSSLDFDCKCTYSTCKTTLINDKLPYALEDLLVFAGPFEITSGFRCFEHNRDVGGQEYSKHMEGLAADVTSLDGLDGPTLAKFANMIPEFTNGGLGVAEKFLHCDVRKVRARWNYDADGKPY